MEIQLALLDMIHVYLLQRQLHDKGEEGCGELHETLTGILASLQLASDEPPAVLVRSDVTDEPEPHELSPLPLILPKPPDEHHEILVEPKLVLRERDPKVTLCDDKKHPGVITEGIANILLTLRTADAV